MIADLVTRMAEAGATNESLAEASGVCANFINKARKGLPVRVFEAELVECALDSRNFKRGKHPITWAGTKRLTYRSAT